MLRQQWTAGSFALLYAGNVLAAGLVLAAWWQSAESIVLRTQVTWLNLAVLAVAVAATADIAWLVAGRRTVAQRRATIALGVAALGERSGAAVRPQEADVRELDTLVAGSAMTMFHKSLCPMVAGKQVKTATRAAHERAGRRPCGVCRP